jgi:hypothetical protein
MILFSKKWIFRSVVFSIPILFGTYSISIQNVSIADKWSATGGWAGGYTACIALIFAIYQYQNLLITADKEKLAFHTIPKLLNNLDTLRILPITVLEIHKWVLYDEEQEDKVSFIKRLHELNKKRSEELLAREILFDELNSQVDKLKFKGFRFKNEFEENLISLKNDFEDILKIEQGIKNTLGGINISIDIHAYRDSSLFNLENDNKTKIGHIILQGKYKPLDEYITSLRERLVRLKSEIRY